MKTKIKLIMTGLAAVTLAAGTAQATLVTVNWSVSGANTVGGFTLNPNPNPNNTFVSLPLTVGQATYVEQFLPISIATGNGAGTYTSSETIIVDGAATSQEFLFSLTALTITIPTVPPTSTKLGIVVYDNFNSSFSFDLSPNLKLTIDLPVSGVVITPETVSKYIPATFTLVAVPEPSTVVAGILVLLPFGVSSIRSIRKNRL